MRIFHPRPENGRQKFIGVEFRGGVAEVDSLHPERRLALEQHGYRIEDDTPVEASVPLRDLSVSELREIARFEGVDVPKGAKKADIVAALEQERFTAGVRAIGEGLGITVADLESIGEVAAELPPANEPEGD